MMENVTLEITVPTTTYRSALEAVDSVLVQLDMKRTAHFRLLGAMQKLSQAVAIAEKQADVAPKGAEDV